jgi:hypothetical protein
MYLPNSPSISPILVDTNNILEDIVNKAELYWKFPRRIWWLGWNFLLGGLKVDFIISRVWNEAKTCEQEYLYFVFIA